MGSHLGHLTVPKQAKEASEDVSKDVEDLLTSSAKTGMSIPKGRETSEVLNELAQDLDSDESCGPAVSEKLASVVNKTFRTKMSEEKLKDKASI